jgi:3-dehydroquinate dehydratase/shikimate dehydrogenase
MQKPMIAVSVVAETPDMSMAYMDRASRAGADVAEMRIDRLQNINLREPFRYYAQMPKIATIRPVDEGGSFKGPEDLRIYYLEEAADLGAAYVDIEARHFRRIKRDPKRTRLIVSYHDFKETPEDLDDIYKEIVDKGADIVKIATMANSEDDNLRMLELVQATAQPRRPIIGICMGELGKETRVLGPLVGGYLTFAALENGQGSAPGQLTITELRHAWKKLDAVPGLHEMNVKQLRQAWKELERVA